MTVAQMYRYLTLLVNLINRAGNYSAIVILLTRSLTMEEAIRYNSSISSLVVALLEGGASFESMQGANKLCEGLEARIEALSYERKVSLN